MSVTIYDVAREARVSLATVSRVLNDSPLVKDSTRARVQEAIERLGYEPNLVASALMTKRTGLVALLVPDVSNPFYAEVARGVEDAASRHGYNCVICNVGDDRDKQVHYVRTLRRKGIDGIIFGTAVDDDRLVLGLARRRYPLALLARDVPAADVNRVLTDDRAGGAMAATHLLSLGHTGLAVVTEPDDIPSSRERSLGFAEELAKRGLVAAQIVAAGSDIEAGRAAGAKLLAAAVDGVPARPSAVFAVNDLLAVGIVQAAREQGLDVPTDLSVVGFDGTVMAKVATPPLTTVAQPMQLIGRQAFELLLDTIADNGRSRRIVLAPRLVEGGTTAPVNFPES